ncbi:MAG: 30S ribosomal protein S14 [Rickettsiaceae bacterium]|nr:30S ribosomal protein S14 [Rickettsiaceae bacterium]
MAKIGSIERNNKRIKLVKSMAIKRAKLKEQIHNKNTSLEDRFRLVTILASLPRNGAKTRVRNRCILTGRPRGYCRKMGLSRNMLRDLAAVGQLPGVIKASW